jgi:hypothetical protein
MRRQQGWQGRRWLASGAVGLHGKKEMEGGRRRFSFGLSRERERERTGGLGYSGVVWRTGKGGPGVGGARSGNRYSRPNSGGHGRLPATWNRGSEGERGVAGML